MHCESLFKLGGDLAYTHPIRRRISDLRVFDETARTSLRASRNREPHFSYLNESGRPVAEEVRRLIEACFMRYPDSHKKSLLTRLRSPDDQHFLAAFFELYVH